MVLLFFVLTSIIVLVIYCVRKKREAREHRDMLARGSVAHDGFGVNDRQDDSDHLDRSANDRSAINQSDNTTDFEESKKMKGKQNFEKYFDYESK